MVKRASQKSKDTQVARVRRVKPPQPIEPLWLRVANRVEIQDVRLIGCNCRIEPEAISGKKIYQVEQQPTKVTFNEKSGHIFVFPTFDLKAQQEGKPEKTVISINASFLLVYKADNLKDLDQEAFQKFADVNGTYNAWPYWREFVQNVTVRMGVPPLIIQVFHLGGQPARTPPEKTEPTPIGSKCDTSLAKVTA
jgi:preprotein translocase subunit SecB